MLSAAKHDRSLLPFSLVSRRFDLRSFFEAQGFDGLFAQDEFLHFAAARHRVRLDELEVARNLLAANLALAVFAQFFLGQLLARSGDDDSQQFFAEEFVGDAENLHIGYFWMANQEFFDLAREKVLAAANDHLFEAAHDIDVAICIHCRQVAGVQPALGVDGLRRPVGYIVVAGHDDGAATADFAALADRNGRACGRVDDLDIGMWQGFADGCRLALEGVIGQGDGHGAGIFRLAESDDDIGPDTPLDLFHKRNGDGRAGATDLFERREVIFVEIGMLQHRHEHGRDAAGDGAAFAADDLHGLERVEAEQGVDGAAGTEGDQHVAHAAEDVEEWHQHAAANILLKFALAHHKVRLIEQVAMRQYGPFGEAGSAGGVEDHRRVVGSDRCLPFGQLLIADDRASSDHFAEERGSPAILLKIGGRQAEQADIAQQGQPPASLAAHFAGFAAGRGHRTHGCQTVLIAYLRHQEQCPYIALFENVFDLSGPQHRVNRDQHKADFRGGQLEQRDR